MNNLRIYFILRTNKQDKKGHCPIYARITKGTERVELSTGKKVKPEDWDSANNKIIGNSPFSNAVNDYLQQIQRKVLEAETALLKKQEEVTPSSIKTELRGQQERQVNLCDYFEKYNDKIKTLIGKDYSESTYKKYTITRAHLKDFIKKSIGREEISIGKINLKFIKDFEHYLKTKEDPCNHNTAIKYISHLKAVIYEGIDNGILNENPFKKYRGKEKPKDPVYLTMDEVRSIENADITIDRVDRVRDVFLFSCYTGLAFSDVEKIRKSDIETAMDGELWLIVKRTKTKEPSKILLLPKAQTIIEKYNDDPETQDGNLLPVISNQKTNAYLKEVAGLAGIKKHLTYHVARHTFATSIALENGVPIETLQQILGHKDQRSTMHYARVTRRKVGKDMKMLRKVIS